MIILGPILKGVLSFGITLLTIYFWIVIIRVIMSWVNPDPYNPIVSFLMQVTDPILWRIKRIMPFLQIGMIDLTPWVLVIAIQILIDILRNFYAMVLQGSHGAGGLF